MNRAGLFVLRLRTTNCDNVRILDLLLIWLHYEFNSYLLPGLQPSNARAGEKKIGVVENRETLHYAGLLSNEPPGNAELSLI